MPNTNSNPDNILIIEDDNNIRRFLSSALEMEGFNVFQAENGNRGLIEAASRQPNLIIIDLGLPDADGKDIISQLRTWLSIPIIVLSARHSETEKVASLDAGADDYLVKPFGIPELLARVRAQLRRKNINISDSSNIINIGNIYINLANHEVKKNQQLVHLTPIEFRLLCALIKGRDKVLTHRQLILETWGPAYIDRPHYLRIYMSNLRQKLEDDASQPKYFITELQVGYRLVGEI